MTKQPLCDKKDCQQEYFRVQIYEYVRKIITNRLMTYMSFVSLLNGTPAHSKKYNQYVKILEECCANIETLREDTFKGVRTLKDLLMLKDENQFLWKFLDKLNLMQKNFSPPKKQLIFEHIEVSKAIKFCINEKAIYQILLNCVSFAMQDAGTVQMGCSRITEKSVTFTILNPALIAEPSKKLLILKLIKKNYLLEIPTNELEMKLVFIFHYVRIFGGKVSAKMTLRGKIQFDVTIPRTCKNEV